jgi:hypothetical protein
MHKKLDMPNLSTEQQTGRLVGVWEMLWTRRTSCLYNSCFVRAVMVSLRGCGWGQQHIAHEIHIKHLC